MQRNARGLLIGLNACLLVGLFALYTVRRVPPKPDLEHEGGTVLVYEVNTERARASEPPGNPAAGLSGEELDRLAAAVKRRVDPDGSRNAAVRPVGDRRVEIAIPSAGEGKADESARAVEEAKWLVSQAGVLEFRIVANGTDDEEAVVTAGQVVDNLPVPELRRLARDGLPPPAPEGEFRVDTGRSEAKVRYAWAELGPEERASLQLVNAERGRDRLYTALTGGTDRVLGVGYDLEGYVPSVGDRASMFLYCRACESGDQIAHEVRAARRAAAEGRLPRALTEGRTDEEVYRAVLTDPAAAGVLVPKRWEFFVLTRVSPEDSLRIGGDVTLTASLDTDPTGRPGVLFRLNEAGADRFRTLTRRNCPSGEVTRQVAILLDGRVLSAPTIRSEIGAVGSISGNFDREALGRLVRVLSSGALPFELHELPVSESAVAPTLARDTAGSRPLLIGIAAAAVVEIGLIGWWLAGGRASGPVAAGPPAGEHPGPVKAGPVKD